MRASSFVLSAVVALSVAAACRDSNSTAPDADDSAQPATRGSATGAATRSDTARAQSDTARARPDTARTRPDTVRPRSDTARARPDTGRTRPDTSGRPPVDTLPPGNGTLVGTVFVTTSYIIPAGDSAGQRGVRLERRGGVTVKLLRPATRDSTRGAVDEREVASVVSDSAGRFATPPNPDGSYVLRAVPPAGSGLRAVDLFVHLVRGRSTVPPFAMNVVLRP